MEKESKIYSKSEAVEMYGSEKLKTHFAKYKKITNKDLENALIKTLKQNYSSVEKVKIGRSIHYRVGDRLEEVLIREDGRVSNGAWSIDYTKNMDILVVSALEIDNLTDNAQTMRKWLLDFKLIDRGLFELMGLKNSHDEKRKLKHVNKLIEGNIIRFEERKILDDYAEYAKELMGQLERTLNRMKKANIIDFYEVPKAKLIQTELEIMSEEEPKIVNLHESTVKKINQTRIKMMDKYDLNPYEWANLTNRQDVKLAKEEFNYLLETQITDENGNHLPIEFSWKAHAIILKATKKRTMTYLKKYNDNALDAYKEDKIKFININKDEYISGRFERVIEIAGRKQTKYSNDKESSVMGKNKPSYIQHPFDTGYYELLLNNQYVEKIGELEKVYGSNF